MIPALAIAASTLAILSDDEGEEDIDQIFQKAYVLNDARMFADATAAAYAEPFRRLGSGHDPQALTFSLLDRFASWISSSPNLDELRDRISFVSFWYFLLQDNGIAPACFPADERFPWPARSSRDRGRRLLAVTLLDFLAMKGDLLTPESTLCRFGGRPVHVLNRSSAYSTWRDIPGLEAARSWIESGAEVYSSYSKKTRIAGYDETRFLVIDDSPTMSTVRMCLRSEEPHRMVELKQLGRDIAEAHLSLKADATKYEKILIHFYKDPNLDAESGWDVTASGVGDDRTRSLGVHDRNAKLEDLRRDALTVLGLPPNAAPLEQWVERDGMYEWHLG